MARAAPLTGDDVRAALGVSRETQAQLALFVERLAVWNRTINLVAESTLADPWRRHVLDSAQLMGFVPPDARVVVDLGSGAGLPGLVLAILGVPDVHLIESDRRKAAFLLDMTGRLGLRVRVHTSRIEAVAPLPADVVTARALAPLPRLLDLAAPFLRPATRCLFLEGKSVDTELTAIRPSWTMTPTIHVSRSDPDGRVLVLDGLRRVEENKGA